MKGIKDDFENVRTVSRKVNDMRRVWDGELVERVKVRVGEHLAAEGVYRIKEEIRPGVVRVLGYRFQ